jgi:membrane protein YqaA with SNARE-associated domain
MKHLASVLSALIWKLGGPGLLILGILDSSFLVAPLGNDLLVIAMTSRNRDLPHMLYYCFMSSVGSVLGVALIDLVVRGLGEAGLHRYLPRKRIAYIKDRVQKNSGWALVVASIAPPPFPFTPFIVAASALQYPRKKMFLVVGFARMARFGILGVLALFYGRTILRWFGHPYVQAVCLALVGVAVLASAISIFSWIKRSRRQPGALASEPVARR